MKEYPEKLKNRRATLKAFLRWGACGVCIGSGGFLFAKRSKLELGQSCTQNGLCDQCGLWDSCELPQAKSLKQRARE